jgi:hypothetical protein
VIDGLVVDDVGVVGNVDAETMAAKAEKSINTRINGASTVAGDKELVII